MERLSINYYDPNFNPSIADDCSLQMVIGTDGLSLCVKNNISTLVLKYWIYDPDQCEQTVRKILNTNDLTQYPYGKTKISFFTPLQTLAPRRMFDPDQAVQYLQTLIDNTPEKIFFQELPALDNYLVWGVPSDLNDICRYFFPNAVWHAMSAPLLLYFRELSASSGEAQFYAHIRSSHIQIFAFDGGNLLFFNTFKYEKPADVLYFTLLAYDHANCKPGKSSLTVSGDLLEDSEIHKTFQRFIREIRFLPSPTLPGIPQHILPHLYTDQTIC